MQLGLNRHTFKDLENKPQLTSPSSFSMPRNTFNHGHPQLTCHSCKPLLGLFSPSQNSGNDPPVKFYLPSYAFFLYIFVALNYLYFYLHYVTKSPLLQLVVFMGVSPCYIFDIFISWCIPCDIALIQQVLACANRQTHANTLLHSLGTFDHSNVSEP